jgi:hypothetical protein
MANQFLIKNTMADMRGLSTSEITSLQGTNPTYEGVELLGYYEKGDTPAPIKYYLSNTTILDDGGAIIAVNSIKLEHRFTDLIDVNYFGANPSILDNSTPINNAISYAYNNGVSRVVTYGELKVIAKTVSRNSGCIELRSNVSFENYGTIILEPNALLQYAIIGGVDVDNFQIVAGHIIGDNLNHQGDSHEHGMGIGLQNATDFLIKEGTISHCVGDGIYLFGNSSPIDSNIGCYNGEIRNIVCDKNRRNGNGLICCENIRIKSSVFKNTKGKAPMAGVDIEPNAFQNCKNITITDCEFYGNENLGLSIVTHKERSVIEGVVILNCKFENTVLVSQSANESTSITKDIIFDKCFVKVKNTYGFNFINGVSNVTVENCDISILKESTYAQNCVGIRIFNSNNCNLLNNMIKSDGSGTYGVMLENMVDENNISGNNISGFTYGIFIAGGVNNRISHNYVHNISNRGIWNYSSKGSIDHNALNNIGSTGIEQNSGSYNTISFNRLFNTGTSYLENSGRSIYLNNNTNGNRILYNSIQNDDLTKRIKYGIEDYPGTLENIIAWNTIDNSYFTKVRNVTTNKLMLDYGTDFIPDITVPDASDDTSDILLTNITKARVNDILNQMKAIGYINRS